MTRIPDSVAAAYGVPADTEPDWLPDHQSEADERADRFEVEAHVDRIRDDVERRARIRREREAGPKVERHCATCGDVVLAPADAKWARCWSDRCRAERALVPLDGAGRVDALERLAREADDDAARWLTYDASRPAVMRELAAKCRAHADRFRAMADEARGMDCAAEEE